MLKVPVEMVLLHNQIGGTNDNLDTNLRIHISSEKVGSINGLLDISEVIIEFHLKLLIKHQKYLK